MPTTDRWSEATRDLVAQAIRDANHHEAWDATYPLIPAGHWADAVLDALAGAHLLADPHERTTLALTEQERLWNRRAYEDAKAELDRLRGALADADFDLQRQGGELVIVSGARSRADAEVERLRAELEELTAERVRPDHDARVRADERRRVAEEIARAIEAKADAHNARIAEIAGVSDRGRDGMTSGGIRSAALVARAHTTEGGTDA